MREKKIICLTVNAAWNVVTFRSGLIRQLIVAGYDVMVVAPRDAFVTQILKEGCRYFDIRLENSGTNPFQDFHVFYQYWKIFRKERPDVILAYTIKPNIYGSLAARVLGIPVINTISGLGTAFLSSRWLSVVARSLYLIALRHSERVFFQNQDDMKLFLSSHLVRQTQAHRVAGSGVDLEYFKPRLAERVGGSFRFLFVGRLLWDKGVGEYVEALRILHREGYECEGRLLGFLDARNRSAIPREQIRSWEAEGVVSYLGHTADVRPHLASADCVVLPSYREGAPRALLEAASMRKPSIATDVPGCREVVKDGVTGFLVQAGNVDDLAFAMKRIMGLPLSEIACLGQNARDLIEKEFDENTVIRDYVGAIAATTSVRGLN